MIAVTVMTINSVGAGLAGELARPRFPLHSNAYALLVSLEFLAYFGRHRTLFVVLARRSPAFLPHHLSGPSQSTIGATSRKEEFYLFPEPFPLA